MNGNKSEIAMIIDGYIEKTFPYLFLILCFTMTFAKIVAGPVYATCMALFATQMFIRKAYTRNAGKYYLAVLLYLLVIALSLTYTSDFMEGLGILKQQCLIILGVVLIEKIPTVEAARRCLCAYALGGTVLAFICIYQGLLLNTYRPPTIWHPVHAGTMLSFSAVLITAFIVSEKTLMLRVLGILMLAVHVFALYLNGTRGAWLALVTVLFLLPFICHNFNLKKKLAYLVLLSVLCLAACKGGIFQEKIHEAANDIKFYELSNPVTSLGARFEMWKISSQMFRKNPVLGIGVGSWEYEFKKIVVQNKAPLFLEQFNQTHSIYFDALSTRGLVGLASLLILIACPLYYAKKSSELENALFRNIIIFVAVAFIISGLTETLVRIRFIFMSYTAITGIGLAALIKFSVKKVDNEV